MQCPVRVIAAAINLGNGYLDCQSEALAEFQECQKEKCAWWIQWKHPTGDNAGEVYWEGCAMKAIAVSMPEQ